MMERTVAANGIEMCLLERGTGPLVLLCHGWPDLSHGWRRQLPAIADAGFRVVAPDMRGFGKTTAPADIGAYTLFDVVGDLVALIHELGEKEACIVGHDWGAHVAFHTALFRPDIFKCAALLSVPPGRRSPEPPLEMLRKQGFNTFYWQYFQEPGVAEKEFERDVDRTMRTILFGRGISLVLRPSGGFLDGTEVSETLPQWLEQADLDTLVQSYRQAGFRGGLNWYRNIDRNWQLTAPWQDAIIEQPVIFIAGSKDGTIHGPMGEKRLKEMDAVVPNLKEKLILDGAGHWVHQERASEVNAALIPFLSQHGRLSA